MFLRDKVRLRREVRKRLLLRILRVFSDSDEELFCPSYLQYPSDRHGDLPTVVVLRGERRFCAVLTFLRFFLPPLVLIGRFLNNVRGLARAWGEDTDGKGTTVTTYTCTLHGVRFKEYDDLQKASMIKSDLKFDLNNLDYPFSSYLNNSVLM